jgi:hypothetical protein
MANAQLDHANAVRVNAVHVLEQMQHNNNALFNSGNAQVHLL